MSVHIFAHLCVYVGMYMRVCLCMCVYAIMCMHVHVYALVMCDIHDTSIYRDTNFHDTIQQHFIVYRYC